jgi:glyoxylase-like metal-dependent hydrolase (beta-lactamase superfamily II)
MRHAGWLPAVALAMAAGCAQAPPEQQILNDAATALGGADRIQAATALRVEGDGVHYNLGQDMTPGASGQTFTVTDLRRGYDLTAARMRTEQTRTPNFAFFQGPQPQRQVLGVDGDVGYNVLPNGNTVRVAAPVAHERLIEYFHHPLTLLRAALAPGATMENSRNEGDTRVVDVTTADGYLFELAIGPAGDPVRISSRGAHPNLGDVVHSTSFADYEAVNGLRLPSRVEVRVDDFTTAQLRFASQAPGGEAGDLVASDDVRSSPLPAQLQPNVVAEVVGPGLWLLAGQSHHSALAEFEDHLVLIEAPQSEARTLAAIAAARELRPEKPLTKVVPTHHHFDHTAGIRAAIAEGLTVVTHAGNRAFFEEMARRPHTIVPDTLARMPRALTIEEFGDELVLEDKAMSMTIYHIAGNPHSDTMVMAYFPRHRVVVQVDAYSPQAQAHPFAANLLDEIRRRNLRVDRIVPLHGTIVPFAELERAVGGGSE